MHALQASVLLLFHGGKAILTPKSVREKLNIAAPLANYILLSLLFPPKVRHLKTAKTQALLQSNGTTTLDQNRRAKESSAMAAAGPESEEGAAGSLASATAAVDVIIREKTPERLGQLPEAVKNNLLTPVGSPSRTRHWIRQPD